MEIKNPAFNYDKFGGGYSRHRQADPRIAAYINRALGNAETILNVGSGAGSYEPKGKYVIAVEPSVVMRTQRLQSGKKPAISGKADQLPFDEGSFDAVMAMVTVHHWPDMKKGLLELKRVAREKVVVMTFDPGALDNFWNAKYFPEVIAVEKARYPTIDFITAALGGNCEVWPIPIPLDCSDGFQEAFYGRPEAFLDREVRLAQSAWGFISDDLQNIIVKRLADDLTSGEWDRKYGYYRSQPTFTCALRLIVSTT